MADLLCEIQDKVMIIALNRCEKQNAFDDQLLLALQARLEEGIANPKVHVILLRANGRHFSAGADAQWMQRMASFSESENQQDAMVLAQLMHSLHHCPKPTIAAVHGAAYGGGAGLVAACDIAIAADNAKFCFSEVKLGLIPAVISPYVIKAMGERVTQWLFMSAEVFSAEQAQAYKLVHICTSEAELTAFAIDYAKKLANLAPQAVKECKQLIATVANQPIDNRLITKTAQLIAQKRISAEGQQGLLAFLNKKTPKWD